MTATDLELQWRLDALQPGQRLPFDWGKQEGWVERLAVGFGVFAETAVAPLELVPLLRLLNQPGGETPQVLLWRERLLVCVVFPQPERSAIGDFVRRYAARDLVQIATDRQTTRQG